MSEAIKINAKEEKKRVISRIKKVLKEKTKSEFDNNYSELARVSSVSNVTLCKIKQSNSYMPSLSTVVDVFATLGVPMSELFAEKKEVVE